MEILEVHMGQALSQSTMVIQGAGIPVFQACSLGRPCLMGAMTSFQTQPTHRLTD